jgi:hypothetical protein
MPNEEKMSDEKMDRIVVRQELGQSPSKRKPIVPRRPWRPRDEINSLADKVACDSSVMQLVNSARGSNDRELGSRVLEKVREEVRQIDPTASNSDAARVLLVLAAKAG